MVDRRIFWLAVIGAVFTFAVCSWGAVFAGPSGTERMHFNVDFDESDLSFSEVEGYDLVKVMGDRCSLAGEPGTPWLPVRSIHVLIPVGSKVAYVEATVEEEVELEGEYNICPAQPPIPTSSAGRFEFVQPDGYVYAGTQGVRPEAAQLVDTVIIRGHHVAVIRVCPLDYVPATGRLTLRKMINLTLIMETDAGVLAELAAKTMRYRFRSSAFEGLIKADVINPQALKSDYFGGKSLAVSQVGGFKGISPAESPTVDIGESLLMEESGGGSQVDPCEVQYLLIGKLTGPQNHKQALEPLVDWKRIKGIPTEAVDVSWIYSNYSGDTNQQKIKACIKDYVENKGTIWVLLAGDDTIVPDRNCYGYVDALPEPAEDYTIPTDLYYACLDDMDWNDDDDGCPCELEEDGDTVDLGADVFVGRLPVRSPDDTDAIVSKILQYEKGSVPNGFGEKMLLSGSELWVGGDAECKSEKMYDYYISPYWDETRYRFYDTATDFEGGAAYDVTVAHINEQLGNGYNFFHMATHGDWPLWQTETGSDYYSSDALDANNVDKYANVVTIACNSNGFDKAEPSLSEAFIRNSEGGTVSYIGASRFGFGYAIQCSLGPSFEFDSMFYQHLFNEEDPGHMWEMGRPYKRAKNYWLGSCDDYNAYRWLMFCINLVGDPEMMLHTETPGSISVKKSTLVFNKSFRVDVSKGGDPVEAARVAISHPTVMQDYWVGQTGADGVVVFSDIDFTNPNDEYDIVVTAHNCVPYEAKIKGYASVQAAINAASDYDEIVLAPDTWYESIDFIGKSITVRGMYPEDWLITEATIIDANGADYGVVFESTEDANSILKGLTVRNASSGVYANGGSPQNQVCPTVTRCILQDNGTGLEYGQYCDGGWITNNIIRANTDYGILGSKGEADVGNNWIYDNDTGIKVSTSSVQIHNNTIIDNTSKGIQKSSGGTVNISNCILWGNGDDLSGCSATYSCIKDPDQGQGNIHSEPYFIDPNTRDLHLHQHSPCINAGDPSGNYEGQTDIDGQDRVVGGRIDMGADEFRAVHNITKDIWYVHIQSAINGASEGDELVALPGTYYESIGIGKGITLRSTDPNDFDIVKATIIDSKNLYGAQLYDGVNSDPVLTGFTVTGAPFAGVGIFSSPVTPTVSHCIIRDNGYNGIYINTSSPLVANNWIYNNDTGIFTVKGYDVFANNTITNNTNYGIETTFLGSNAAVRNCIVWSNGDSDDDNIIDPVGNISTRYSCVQGGYSGQGNIDSDPEFVDADNGDYHLSYGSACINTGDPNGGYSHTDIDGQSRVSLGRIDMGADEVIHVYNLDHDKWYDSIQEAIDMANDGETVVAYPARYYESIRYWGKAITLRSSNPDDLEVIESTIIDGDYSTVTFRNEEDANSVLEGFTITGASSSGIYCNRSCPTIRHCIIRDNAGRGVHTFRDAPVLIENCWIHNNGSRGLYSQYSGHETLVNTTIADNGSFGIRAYLSETIHVTNCIIWGNSGGGIYPTSTREVAYSCVQGGSVYAGEGNINIDPNFVDADNGDYHLSPDSPCINTGDPNGDYTGQTDIDGDSRVVNDRVDMGADEATRVRNITQGKSYWYLGEAISDASTGDEIVVSPGTYYDEIHLSCSRRLTIRSEDPCDLNTVRNTVIYGANFATVYFYCIDTSEYVLKGLTITGSCGIGIRVLNSLPQISNCIIRDINGYGISIAEHYAGPTIENCWINGNDYGIYCYNNADATLTNITVADNTNYGISKAGTGLMTVTNSIVWDNGDQDSDNILGNPVVTYSCVKGGFAGAGNISTDPNFVDAANDDYRLTHGSGCIDSANGNVDPPTDIDGQSRIDDPDTPNTGVGDPNYVDMGAQEYNPN